METTFVWFDLGYTLVYLEREQWFAAYLAEQGIARKLREIELAYHYADKLFMREYPGVLGREAATFFPWYLGVLNYRLGLCLNLQEQWRRLNELRTDRRSPWAAYPCAAQMLEELKQASYGIGLISNWDSSARQVLADTGLLPYFDHVIVSSEVGVEKPDRAIFELALRQAGVRAEECCYVGDNYYDDVVGCREVGMECCLINRFGRTGIEEVQHEPVLASVQELPAYLQRKEWKHSV
ncbi:HAD family hydrolase [Paenibacillus tyrfis]|uniref:Haloacid dehalogenase n=1 Tax=Paenibacillus tyrfis TaxID=1501230 RepID=A0A081P7K5_9BACL|nr:HAD family hydrolase [Paenibacillus tyrfis]KEQ26678.1 haloacid dehalogenase [Paenibacillus tyrfis]